jgi:SAM-dependent methyltransferase
LAWASFAQEVVAIDVSRDAVASVRERFGGKGLRVAVAGMPGLPFPPSSFDLVIAADVIHEAVVPERRSEVLREISRLLKDDGSALLSDYLKPADFEEFRGQVSRNGFKIVRIIPMHDRTWYQFESWFKSIRGWGWVKKLLASHAIARALKFPSRLMGFSGSRHVLILAQKGWGHSHD